MKPRIPLLSAAAACLALAGCGGGGTTVPYPPSSPPPPPPPMTMQLDTAAVLAIIQTKTSETASPFQVNGSAVEVIPVNDETGSPISVNAP